MDLIMCANPIKNKREPDPSYEQEYKDALTACSNSDSIVHLFDIFNIKTLVLPTRKNRDLIYHGWMQDPQTYKTFYNRCKSLGYDLINSLEQYKACHWFEGWYPHISDMTPLSKIIKRGTVREMMDEVLAFMVENECPVIIKGQVKSLKHRWREACYIEKNANALDVAMIVSSFVQEKEETRDFQGDMVVRKFVDLKQIDPHPKSKMPRAKEFRSFVFRNDVILTTPYWSDFDYKGEEPDHTFIKKVASKIFEKTGSNFFTLDVAQQTDDEWMTIDVGDGSVSAVPDHCDKVAFFKQLIGT